MEFAPARSLENKVILLTGAAGHLGSALAMGLAQQGAHVLLNGRTEPKLHLLSQKIAESGGSSTVCCFDVTDRSARSQQLAQILKCHGHLDGLVNNAYHGRTGTVESSRPEDFQSAYQVTTTAAFELVQEALPLLSRAAELSSGGSSVVNIASMYGAVSPDPRIYGDSGMNSPPYYGAAKAALLQLTRYLACHLAPLKVRVNAISPGPFPSPRVASEQPEFHQLLCQKSPLGRTGEPSELVGPLAFLLSDAASYVTGINLPVDGGWTAW